MLPTQTTVETTAPTRAVEHRCPHCFGEIASTESEVRCEPCQQSWSAEYGFPHFCEEKPIWHLHTDEDFEELLDICRRDGWEQTIKTREADDRYQWIRGQHRSEGLYYTAINPESSVLEVGSGWGGMTMSIAKLAKEVHCLDNGPQGLRFINMRAQQEGLDNVVTSRSNAHQLPYSTDSFDLVVLSGVLEFVASAMPGIPPREAQRRVLAECLRVLKPGGQIYVAIENRYGINYMLGVTDEHTGLKWITLLPRWLGAAYHRWVKKEPYRHWIYSYWSLRKLLKDAGYQPPRIVSPWRSYREVSYILDLDSPDMVRQWFREHLKPTQKGSRLFRRLCLGTLNLGFALGLHRTPLLKLFPVCFFAIAGKPRPTN